MGIRSQRNYVRVLRFFDLPRQSIIGATENLWSKTFISLVFLATAII